MYEKEWRDFEARNRRFTEHLPKLKATVESAFRRDVEVKTTADLVVLTSGLLCAEDFGEILLLCGSGYGIGGLKLLRSMYEHAVTGHYIHDHPEKADSFVGYSAVQEGKRADRILEEYEGILSADRISLFEAASKRGKAARQDCMVTDCEKCGTKRLNNTWGLDLVSMAREVKGLKAMVVECYFDPLAHAHGTFRALQSRLKQDENGWRFDDGPQDVAADDAVRNGHLVLLAMLQVVDDHFGLIEAQEGLAVCNRAFREIWLTDSTSQARPPGV
jgi:hypothetical protein